MSEWTFPACERLIVIGDIHGDLQRLTECFYKAGLINHQFQWIASPPNTWVIQLGDQVDSMSRGTSQSWETMADVNVIHFMDQMDAIARPHGGRVISIIGNHELMNVLGDFSYVSPKSISELGGPSARAHKFRPGGPIAKILAKRPVAVKIGELLFCHAGMLPHHLHIAGSIDQMNIWTKKFLLREPFSPMEADGLQKIILNQSGILWNRHYSEISDHERLTSLNHVLSLTGCKAMFVGHTVVPQIIALYDRKLWFVDNGVSRAFDIADAQILEILHNGVPLPENDHTPYRVIIVNKK